MAVCQVCKRDFKRLKFVTNRIKVCVRCVNTLNDIAEPAINAQIRLGELLAKGMERNALRDLNSNEKWKHTKARWTLDNFEAAHEKALPSWLNKLLANQGNTTRDFKMLRAQRRGLLRLDGDRPWSYPSNWADVAAGIRARDDYQCAACGATDVMLDVHHIIYLSNYGTNQQNNLVTLCRSCHETEHGRVFDFGEADDPASPNPIQPILESAPHVEVLDAPQQNPSPSECDNWPPAHSIVNDLEHSCPECGEGYSSAFRTGAGDVLQCTICGFMPSLHAHLFHLVESDPTESLSEGAYVYERQQQEAAHLSNFGLDVQRDKSSTHPTDSNDKHREPNSPPNRQVDYRLLIQSVLVGVFLFALVLLLGSL